MTRAAGVLLHPTCLPGPFGIGDLGPQANRFLDWLATAGQSYWQVLPLSPVAQSGSPYRSYSAFAGNPLLISPELLLDGDLLDPLAIELPSCDPEKIDLPTVRSFKTKLLRQAWLRKQEDWPAELRTRFEAFCDDPETRAWLDDWALFAALKDLHEGKPWYDWPASVRQREPEALAVATRKLQPEIGFLRFTQFLFFDQWEALRNTARQLGIRFIGDLAIYVAPDSADVWSNQEIFDLDASGQPRTVAGVPPDYFSKTGQLWGNPLYRWDRLANDDYAWWMRRLSWSLRSADLIRLDHFRGFAAGWEVAAGKETAIEGRWRPGPGLSFFEQAEKVLGDLPLIAEDLGVITEEVRSLRKATGLPGMRVLQFGLSEVANEHSPHRLSRDTVVYTGTHDNDTARGWFESLEAAAQRRILTYLGGSAKDISRSLIRAAFTSRAETAIIPLQDILALDSSARLNTPGEPSAQWVWRLANLPDDATADSLRRLTEVSERVPLPTPDTPPRGS